MESGEPDRADVAAIEQHRQIAGATDDGRHLPASRRQTAGDLQWGFGGEFGNTGRCDEGVCERKRETGRQRTDRESRSLSRRDRCDGRSAGRGLPEVFIADTGNGEAWQIGMSHSSSTEAASEAKFRLAGKVAGIDACQLISDCDEVVVGSALNCDLIMTDPLVPRKAFRLMRQRDHVDPEDTCETYWILETFNGARVYVYNDLCRRGRVALGDTISLGCHQFHFTVADPNARNYESNTQIDDLCDRLLCDAY